MLRPGTPGIEEYRRRREISATSLERWARHLLSTEELSKRKEHLNICAFKSSIDREKRRHRNAVGKRTPTGVTCVRIANRSLSGVFWRMHVEAMNWSGTGGAEYAAALGLSPYALRIWRNRCADSGKKQDWRSLLHPSAWAELGSAASCVRHEYRLTPQEADA